MEKMNKFFASDNYSGVHPKVMDAVVKSNVNHAFAYGFDEYTAEAIEEIKKVFGDVKAYFAINGTGANVLAMEAMKGKAVTSIICTQCAHIFTDETGAPSKITGVQMLPVPTKTGKIDLEAAKMYFSYMNTPNRANPNAITITQASEFGTIYTLDEIRAVSKFAKENGMYFHMDGARISNAAVSLGCTLKEMTGDLGVDVLSFGGIKNGLMFGEVVVFFNKKLAEDFLAIRKQNLQLNSKMRYTAVQYTEYLRNNLWYDNAKNANDMATYFAEELRKIKIEITNDVKGNTILAILPKDIIDPMIEFCHFYIWDAPRNEVRFVTSFDTTREDIDTFINKLKSML